MKDANSDSTNDGSTIKFVFDLSDGTNYELVYIGIATKRDTYNLKLLIFIILHLLTSLVFGQTYLRCGLTFNNPYDWKQLSTKTRGAAVIIGCRARVIFYSASESVMVNCASSNAASVMFAVYGSSALPADA